MSTSYTRELQAARARRGLTNAQIARALGVSESYISKLMSGARTPKDREILDRIEAFLGVTAQTA